MTFVSNKSEDEYKFIGDKGVIGFNDIDNCRNNNPSEDSQIVDISFPFSMVNGEPQSVLVGETISDYVTIKNITNEHLDIWKVDIYASRPKAEEGFFVFTIVDPTTIEYDHQFLSTNEDKIVRTDMNYKFWILCTPKEIGLYTAIVHISFGDETIERIVWILAEDEISKSLISAKDTVNVHLDDDAYGLGRRPSKVSSYRDTVKIHSEDYLFPSGILEMVRKEQIPEMVDKGLNKKNYYSFFRTLLAMGGIHLEEDMSAYDMQCVVFKRQGIYLTIEVHGSSDIRPSLVNGDVVLAKLANEDQTGAEAYWV